MGIGLLVCERAARGASELQGSVEMASIFDTKPLARKRTGARSSMQLCEGGSGPRRPWMEAAGISRLGLRKSGQREGPRQQDRNITDAFYTCLDWALELLGAGSKLKHCTIPCCA